VIDQHASLSEKFLKKGFWLYLFSFIIAPMGYIIKITISWELQVEEVGILYWIVSLIILLSAYNDFWVTESLNHFIPKFITDNNYAKIKTILLYSLIIQLITSILLTLFFFYGANFIAENYLKTSIASDTLKIFSLYFIGINLFQIISTFFMSVQNTLYSKIGDFMRMSTVLLFTLWVFFLDYSSLTNYAYWWIVGLYIGVVISMSIFIKKYYIPYLRKSNIIWDMSLLREVLWYAFYVFLWVQAATILWQIDMQMVLYILGTKSAWYYTNYLSIVSIPFMIIGPIFALLFPIFSELHAKKENEKITIIKKIFSQNLVHIGIAVNILFFVFAEIIAYILFGEKFVISWTILKYSVLFLVFNFLLQINFNILAGIWQVEKRVKIISIAIIFNIITNLIFIKLIWMWWAALATWIGWILIWVLSEIYLGKEYKVKFNLYPLIKNVLSMWFIWILLSIYIVPIFLDISRWNQFFLLTIISIVYFAWFLYINKWDFSYFIKEVKKIRS
jgi:stage V sporulation protein B